MLRASTARVGSVLGSALFLLAACAVPIARPTGPGPVGERTGRWQEQAHWIPMTDQDGTPRLIYARVCLPAGDGPAKVAVLNHGTGLTRRIIEPQPCRDEAPSWFLERGFMVVMPIRRGYGATGGPDSALLATGPNGLRRCDDLEPARIALEAARDIEATVQYATALPRARPDGAVVVGVSTGGYTVMAMNSRPNPKVAAMVNVSGGIGGQIGGAIGQVCHADRLVRDAGRLGATAAVPMLWLYARNDNFFSPDLGRAMHAAFTGAGGKAEFVETRIFGYDGHSLFTGIGGSTVWGPPVEAYLAGRLR
ncbi:MAG: dienelactone hydrolase family protein [Acetobacteraceae bacterium]